MTSTDDPLPDLLRTLRSRLPTDRARAARDLGRLGWLARDALPALLGALRDDDAKVREAAAYAGGPRRGGGGGGLRGRADGAGRAAGRRRDARARRQVRPPQRRVGDGEAR